MDATSVVSAWNVLLQQRALTFTQPTADTWRQIALGWVLHRGPATVTGIYRTLGQLADRHWTVYHKFCNGYLPDSTNPYALWMTSESKGVGPTSTACCTRR